MEAAQLLANKIFIYSNDTIEVNKNAKIESKDKNECTTDTDDGNLDLYSCIPNDYEESSITEQGVLDYYNK